MRIERADLEDARKTLKLMREGHYNFSRADTYIIRDLAMILLYIEGRLSDMEAKQAAEGGCPPATPSVSDPKSPGQGGAA